MQAPNTEFSRAGSLDELRAKGRIVMHGHHRPILVIYDPDASSPSTIVAPTWASRSSAAASKMAS